MAAHTIDVTLLNPTTVDVLQSQNPLEVLRGDTVEWRGPVFDQALIEFRGFLPKSSTIPVTGPQSQPFTSQISGASPKNVKFTVAPDAESGLYLYVILFNGQELNWAVPLFRAGNFNPFFGGIIIRDPN